MKAPFFSSPSLGLCTLLLGASVAQAGLPPYLSSRHRSLIIARADSPLACVNKQVAANSTVANATDTTGTNATSTATPGNATTPTAFPITFNSTTTFPILPSATNSLIDNATATLNATETDSSLPTATDIVSSGDGTPNATSPDAAGSAGDDAATGLRKRIAQFDLPDVATAWQELCLISGADVFTPTGEDSPCVKLAGFDGVNALLANADPCAQQDNADAMIDFAKSAGVKNADTLIDFAKQYRKHPRNALNILGIVPSTPYCQKAPKNPELNGIVNEQLGGVDPGVFGGPNSSLVSFGAPGTCPFGTTPDLGTCSCIPGNSTDASASDFNTTNTANATATVTGTSFSDFVLPSVEAGSNATDTSLIGTFTDVSTPATTFVLPSQTTPPSVNGSALSDGVASSTVADTAVSVTAAPTLDATA